MIKRGEVKMRDSDKAYEIVLQMLISGELRGGQAINDQWLQEKTGVGKTPMREALLRLVQDGYVTAVPHAGMIVTSYNIAQLNSMLSIRSLLQEHLSKDLVQNAREEEIDGFEAEMEDRLHTEVPPSPHTISKADAYFHHMLCELSGDPVLTSVLKKLENMSGIALHPHLQDYYFDAERVVGEYFQIISLLRERDQEGLTAALRRHIPKYGLQHG